MMSALDPAGPQAGAIAWLWWVFLAITTFATLATFAGLAYAIWRPRRNDAGREPHTTLAMTRAVGGSVAITVVLLFVLLVASVAVGRQLTRLERPNAITVHVVARQWWWDVTYDHPTPSQRVNTANEIHVPIGEPVHVMLDSRDVIHSFWVPNLHGKRDAIPAHASDLWIEADRPGVYRGQCAEFCGAQHARMAMFVIAQPRDQFDAWIAQQRQTPPPPGDPFARRGRELFTSADCALCHRVQGTTAGATIGPDLTHVASRETLASGTLRNDAVSMGGWIRDPQRYKPGAKMPAHPELSENDLHAIVDYLGTLK
jgi:cytochrome c oxidase subunit II